MSLGTPIKFTTLRFSGMMFTVLLIFLIWFTSYLNNRQQYVAIGHTESQRQAMTCGIPQGSTLGPLLFLLYINDLPNCSETLTFRMIFADDTNLFA